MSGLQLASSLVQALRELDRAAQEDERGPLSPDQQTYMAQVCLTS